MQDVNPACEYALNIAEWCPVTPLAPDRREILWIGQIDRCLGGFRRITISQLIVGIRSGSPAANLTAEVPIPSWILLQMSGQASCSRCMMPPDMLNRLVASLQPYADRPIPALVPPGDLPVAARFGGRPKSDRLPKMITRASPIFRFLPS